MVDDGADQGDSRRTSQRIPLQHSVIIELSSGIVIRGKTVNVSSGGFYVVAADLDHLVFVGEEGVIYISHANKTASFPCFVAWHDSDRFGLTILADGPKFVHFVREVIRWKLEQRLEKLVHFRDEVDDILGVRRVYYRYLKVFAAVISLIIILLSGIVYWLVNGGLSLIPVHKYAKVAENVQIKEYPFFYTKSVAMVLAGQTLFVHGKVELLDWLVVSREDDAQAIGYIPAPTPMTDVAQRLELFQDSPNLAENLTASKIEERPPVQSPYRAPDKPGAGQLWHHPSGIVFVWIPEGVGFIGQSQEDKEGLLARYGSSLVDLLYDEEKVLHMPLKGFWMARTEVTQELFHAFVKESGYISRSELENGCSTLVDDEWKNVAEVTWRKTGLNSGEHYPVVCVNQLDIEEFIKWINKKSTNTVISLPTEYQWEYASRRGKQETPYPWLGGAELACQFENIADQSFAPLYPTRDSVACGDSYADLAPVGKFYPNNNGLYDMLGNVREWTCSRYEGRRGIIEQPCEPWTKNQLYTVKGGSWFTGAGGFRSARRSKFSADYRDVTLGFRVIALPTDG